MGVSFNPYTIVTELLDTSLFNVLHVQHRKLTLKEQHHIALCIARGLASLHGHAIPIVHRDMKSLNILVSNDLSIVKICDLGMVKLKAAQGQRLESNGTPLWMAPEGQTQQRAETRTADATRRRSNCEKTGFGCNRTQRTIERAVRSPEHARLFCRCSSLFAFPRSVLLDQPYDEQADVYSYATQHTSPRALRKSCAGCCCSALRRLW